MSYVIRVPALSDLDASGRAVLRPAKHACECSDCFARISVGRLCALIDGQIVCGECSTIYAPPDDHPQLLPAVRISER